MMHWNVPLAHLYALNLAADVRSGDLDYCNDHIWDLKVNDGLPACLSLSTSFGLRARRYLMFPLFSEKKISISDPVAFPRPPVVEWALPQFCQITFSPFIGIDVEAEFWVPTSQTICGRFRVINHEEIPRSIRIAWVALLTPLDPGGANQPGENAHRMAAAQIQRGWALAGKTANLAPVICMAGGAEIENVPYPALSLTTEIPAGSWRDWNWAQATLESAPESYKTARYYLTRNWDAERARILMANTGLIEVETNNPAWDLAFALSQQIGLSLFSSSPLAGPEATRLPYPSLLQTRQPDQGFSLNGDGSDYSASWNGQAPLDVRYLADLLLAGTPELIQGLLLNFLAVQDPVTGFVDNRPGLGGKRSRMPACPLLADLTWRVFQQNGDRTFLETSYPALIKYLEFWFSERDLDRDGLPEWDHPDQFGMFAHTVFSPQAAGSQGASIPVVESPALGAFLYRECLALRKISAALGLTPPSLQIEGNSAAVSLAEISSRLQEAVRSAWNESAGINTYRDRDAHNQPPGHTLLVHTGPGQILLQQRFSEPLRFVLRIDTDQEKTKRPLVTLRGLDFNGKACEEIIPTYRWQWLFFQTGRATSRNAFIQIEEIIVENIHSEDTFTLSTPALECQDISLLLPLWAEMLDEGRARVLVEKSITNPEKFWGDYGLRTILETRFQTETREDEEGISLVWNILIGQGLLSYGYRPEAGRLLENLMGVITNTLTNEKCLRGSYNVNTGNGIGERNALSGLAPLGFFLDVLGVCIYNPWKVGLEGISPFPETVRIAFRGLTILRSPAITRLIFPDEQMIEVSDPAPCVISLEE